MPTCQQTMSVTVSGPFTSGPTVVALGDVLPPAGLGAAGPLGRVLRLDLGDLRRRCRASSSTASYFLRSRAFVALGADHQPVLGRQQRAVVVAEDLAGPLVHGPLGELARLVEHADERVAAARPGRRAAAAPTTRGRWPSRRRGRRAAGRPSSGPACSAATSVTSSSPISVSPPTSGGGAIGPPHRVVAAVGRVAPQRVVVAVGLGHVAERVGRRAAVVRRQRVRLGRRRCGPAARSIASSVMPLVRGAAGLAAAPSAPRSSLTEPVFHGLKRGSEPGGDRRHATVNDGSVHWRGRVRRCQCRGDRVDSEGAAHRRAHPRATGWARRTCASSATARWPSSSSTGPRPATP